MLCPNCASELPVTTAFCTSCGTKIEPLSRSAGTQPSDFQTVDSTTNTTGLLVPLANSVAVRGADVGQVGCGVIPPTGLAKQSPPYAIFASEFLAFALCGTVIVFNIARGLARGSWRSTPSTAVAAVLAVVLVRLLLSSWDRLRESTSQGPSPRRKLLTRSIFFTLLFFGTAAIVGNAIGASGKETTQVVADFRELSEVGTRISHARASAPRTVPGNIDMYRSIEADVQEYEATLRRLQEELPGYDAKFPDQHDRTARSIQTVAAELQRASLLKQQIVAAKEMEALDNVQQWSKWQEKMEPLLAAEDALDKP